MPFVGTLKRIPYIRKSNYRYLTKVYCRNMDVISGRKLETLESVLTKTILTSMKNSSEHEMSSFFSFNEGHLAFLDLGTHFGSESTDPVESRIRNAGFSGSNLTFLPTVLNNEKSKEQTNYIVQNVSKRSRLWYFFFACPAGGGPRLGVLGSEILQHRPVHQFLMVGTKARFFNKVLDHHSFYKDQS
jgi:hypothetical protein